MNGPRVTVNLASAPRRNRRFFTALIAAMAAAFLLVAAAAGLTFSRSRSRAAAANASLIGVEQMTQKALKEKNDWDRQVKDWTKRSEDTVAVVNSIIKRKSFSWVDFFTRLEDALPPTSVVLSMTPLQSGDGPLEVQFKVVSASLNELLALLRKLNEQGFKNISVRNEVPASGQVVSEVNLRHERAI